VRLIGRVKSLERASLAHPGACSVCNGAGRAVFSEPLRKDWSRGGPCPSCGRAINVRFVDMIAQRRSSQEGAVREITPCA
jgi:hypothetical protein